MLKKVGYLERLKTAIALMPDHPRHHSVKMQAHHLASAKGIDLAGKSDELEHFGYDINVVENLSFIPCTLQGACHLEVQLHRGDHGSAAPEAADSDVEHPVSYHIAVKNLVNTKFEGGFCNLSQAQIQSKMDKQVSKKMLKQINELEVSLTSISESFDSGGNGCCGVDSVPDGREYSSNPCPVARNHRKTQGPGQRKENIAFAKTPYTLQVKR